MEANEIPEWDAATLDEVEKELTEAVQRSAFKNLREKAKFWEERATIYMEMNIKMNTEIDSLTKKTEELDDRLDDLKDIIEGKGLDV